MNVSALYHLQTESQFQASVIRYAELMGWLCYHVRDSRRSRAGFPDLVLVHPDKRRVIYAELKSERGRASRDQLVWLDALDRCGQEVYQWKPSQFELITRILR